MATLTLLDGREVMHWQDRKALLEQREREHAAWRRRESDRLAQELADVWEVNAARPVDPHMPHAAICAMAERRAELMQRRIAAISEPMPAPVFLDWLQAQVQALQARGLPQLRAGSPMADQLEGAILRAQCPLWWRRQIKRAVIRQREGLGIERHEVCATRRQPYCTDDTVARRINDAARNRAMLERTEIENEHGETLTLWDAVQASTSNKAIRRGELMTRIRGCEEVADAMGYAGQFLTLTAPSRFHATLRTGAPNPRWDGSTPRDAQQWLCKTWQRARAKLHRAGVPFFGFRVAEPHHDGCPHWHALIWTRPEQAAQFVGLLREWWLRDGGDEDGAQRYRLQAKAMHSGQASGYVAKYIAKNIDDAGSVGAEGHDDDDPHTGEAVPMPAQGEMFGGAAQRVEAWAAAWGIRQFQPLGQPPVTVWRELRRIAPDMAAGASPRLREAWAACNRDGDKRADFAGYIRAQGGVMQGRCYALHIVKRMEQRQGRYGTSEAPRLLGVEDRIGRPGEWALSDRKEWRPKGEWRAGEQRPRQQAAPGPRAAWTRVNNCTQQIAAGRPLGMAQPLPRPGLWARLCRETAPPDQR